MVELYSISMNWNKPEWVCKCWVIVLASQYSENNKIMVNSQGIY